MNEYKPARIYGALMLLGLGSFVLGYFANINWLMIIGGIIILLENLLEMYTGHLKACLPIVLAIIGACIFDPWYEGVFWSMAIFEIVNIPINLRRIFSPAKLAEKAND